MRLYAVMKVPVKDLSPAVTENALAVYVLVKGDLGKK